MSLKSLNFLNKFILPELVAEELSPFKKLFLEFNGELVPLKFQKNDFSSSEYP